jgi:hypothetical protein
MIYTYDEHIAAYPDLDTATRQRLGVEPDGTPLSDDGKVGPKTRSGLFIAPRAEHKLVDTALSLVLLGAREEGGNNRGRWPGYLMARPADPRSPQEIAALPPAEVARLSRVQQGSWCAGGASTIIRLAYGAGQPSSWGAQQLVRRWAAKPGRTVALADAQPGDLIAWKRDVPGQPGAGHVGIVWGRSPSGLLLVLECNGSRRGGAVGLYGYSLRDGAKRGSLEVTQVARRADP